MSGDGEVAHLVIKRPLSAIEGEVRRKYSITTPLLEVAVEHDALVLTFQGMTLPTPIDSPRSLPLAKGPSPALQSNLPRIRKRAKRRVRNRMKTRGWTAMGKFLNSRGQVCTVYRPIVDALKGKKLRRSEAYTAVRQLLVANGNDPGPSSVEYFLANHLEYLEKQNRSESEGVR